MDLITFLKFCPMDEEFLVNKEQWTVDMFNDVGVFNLVKEFYGEYNDIIVKKYFVSYYIKLIIKSFDINDTDIIIYENKCLDLMFGDDDKLYCNPYNRDPYYVSYKYVCKICNKEFKNIRSHLKTKKHQQFKNA